MHLDLRLSLLGGAHEDDEGEDFGQPQEPHEHQHHLQHMDQEPSLPPPAGMFAAAMALVSQQTLQPARTPALVVKQPANYVLALMSLLPSLMPTEHHPPYPFGLAVWSTTLPLLPFCCKET